MKFAMSIHVAQRIHLLTFQSFLVNDYIPEKLTSFPPASAILFV